MQLGFLEFEVRKLPVWERFLTDVLGTVDVGQGRYRMDGHAWRFQLREGPADDLVAVGWELTEEELEQTLARLAAANHPVQTAPAEHRGAQRRYLLEDPAGVPTELVTALERAD
ncbi:MAG: hypothetical protein QGG40_13270, partial [Myxococcota bacterium]|nr:hypothetical protein [Myxococcota bacterium]